MKTEFFRVKTNKRGSVSVMLSMMFACLMMVVIVLVTSAAKASGYSYCDCVLQLAGRSVLSEYHKALKEQYGIMAFKSCNQEVQDKLKFYANGSFDKKREKGNLTLIKPKLNRISCELNSYALMDTTNFEKDIVDYMKHPRLKQREKAEKTYSGQGRLINQQVINSLPSKGVEGRTVDIGTVFSKGLPSWKELTSQSTENLVADEYALSHFNYRLGWESLTETFFKNELEYVLYGKFSDAENQEQFIKEFKVARMILNSAHLYADLEKRNQVLEMAELMTPGPQAAVTAIALTEAWAYAETANDAKLVLMGERVALYKNRQNWALDLESAVKGTKNGSCIRPENGEGMTYKEYLKIFLYAENRELKLRRMMDLIQINIQGGFDENFYIKDCYVGLQYKAKIEDQEYGYVQQY
ncbi:DUF5702 domain-containing protein [Aminipila luticellarii]|uniref:Uncharacterized protein n=1 Tax=Aminipila luticellarii TaxID=2507160 RepID=A0A410PUU6_9FIRM|nr:DUF5702 domain-containing protein [Aminipila luticellarii]QAT42721.1 hypothetical protein EQM06_05465 [Aminipila luticellarii]